VDVYLAQNDAQEFNEMTVSECRRPFENVKDIVHGDYSRLNVLKNVVIDHADFCCGWNKVKDCMISRLKNPTFYGDKAIVRLTLCYRNSGTEEDFITTVNEDMLEATVGTNYVLKELSIGQWCNYKKNGFTKENSEKTVYRYNPSMVVFIYLLIKV
jgi:hypothetical protein